MKTFENNEALEQASLQAGQIVATKGGETPNDGAQTDYYINDVDRGYDDTLTLANGNYAERMTDLRGAVLISEEDSQEMAGRLVCRGSSASLDTSGLQVTCPEAGPVAPAISFSKDETFDGVLQLYNELEFKLTDGQGNTLAQLQVAEPTEDEHAATKLYVDSYITETGLVEEYTELWRSGLWEDGSITASGPISDYNYIVVYGKSGTGDLTGPVSAHRWTPVDYTNGVSISATNEFTIYESGNSATWFCASISGNVWTHVSDDNTDVVGIYGVKITNAPV